MAVEVVSVIGLFCMVVCGVAPVTPMAEVVVVVTVKLLDVFSEVVLVVFELLVGL